MINAGPSVGHQPDDRQERPRKVQVQSRRSGPVCRTCCHPVTHARRDVEDYDRPVRLAALCQDPDLTVLDLDDEVDEMEVMVSRAFLAKYGLVTPLGRGERAVLAIGANGEMVAGVDDGAARLVAVRLGVVTMTTQDLLRAAVAEAKLSEREAAGINADLLATGFRGTRQLW